MGFSGGGANVTKAHTHDGSIVQDGGSLNFNNVTQAGLSAGDLTYSDGNALQVLGLGNATETLVVNGAATAPEWAVGGGAAGLEFVEEITQSADNPTFECELSSDYVYADYQELMLQIQMQYINDATDGVGIRCSYAFENLTYVGAYRNAGVYAAIGGNLTMIGLGNTSSIKIISDNTIDNGIYENDTATVLMRFFQNSLEGASSRFNYPFFYNAFDSGRDIWQSGGGYSQQTTEPTTLSSFKFWYAEADGTVAGDVAQNSRCRVYRVINS